VGALPAAAQSLRGRLLDVESNQPVAAGLLTLLTPDSVSITTAVTDADGFWNLAVPGAGTYFVEAKRLGYQPWVAGPVDLKPEDDLNSVFHLRRLAFRLDPIEVSAEATERYLDLQGFYERQRSDFGHFMTPEDIEKRRASRVSDLLMGLPGVNLVSGTSGSVGSRYIQLRGGSLARDGVCRPRIFVDGLMYARGDSRPRRLEDFATEQNFNDQLEIVDQGLSIDDLGHPSIIAAVEIYRSAVQVPVQFGGTSIETQCGVIVIWTRTGRMRMNGQ
jgi:hypothetical protein